MKWGIWGILALKTKMNCKSNTVKYGTEKYKICNGDDKNVNQRKNKKSIWLHGRQGSGTKFYESVVWPAWRKEKILWVWRSKLSAKIMA